MIEVEGSSNIKGMDFELTGDGVGRLTMQFHGSVYDYDDVPESVWDQLMDALHSEDGSVGRSFHALVRGKFEGQKRIEEEDEA